MKNIKRNDKTNLIIGYSISLVAAMCYGTASFLGKILVTDSITPIVTGIYAIFFGSIVLAILVRKEIKSIATAGFKSIMFMSLAGIAGSFAITVFFLGSPTRLPYNGGTINCITSARRHDTDSRIPPKTGTYHTKNLCWNRSCSSWDCSHNHYKQ